MYFKKAFIIERCKRFAIRVDYLPHLKMLSIDRVNIMGQEVSELWHLSEVEKYDYYENYKKWNLFNIVNRGCIDRNLIFKNKRTGKFLYFNQKGNWSWVDVNNSHLDTYFKSPKN